MHYICKIRPPVIKYKSMKMYSKNTKCPTKYKVTVCNKKKKIIKIQEEENEKVMSFSAA